MAVKGAPPVHQSVDPTDSEAAALRALQTGTATPEQQQAALICIVKKISEADGLSFRPGPGGDRDTAFAEGRRFVGLQIIRQLNKPWRTSWGSAIIT